MTSERVGFSVETIQHYLHTCALTNLQSERITAGTMAAKKSTEEAQTNADLEQEGSYTSRTNDASNFCRLPRELRDEIYNCLLLADEDDIDIVSAEAVVPAISHTCRQLRHETAMVFLKKSFIFTMHKNNIEPFIEWRTALKDYIQGKGRGQVKLLWPSCPVGYEDVCRANLLQYFERGFHQFPILFRVTTPDGQETSESTMRTELVLMVKALHKQGLKWADVKVAVEHAIRAAMVSGERLT